MIINAEHSQAICSFGWVHKGSLWVYRIADKSPRVFELSRAKYLTIKEGRNDFFSVVHHFDGDQLEISAHSHAEPLQSVSSISVQRAARPGSKTESKVTGDPSVWRELPRAYVAFAFASYHLFLIQPCGSISVQEFAWYTNTDYDKGYQGIVGVEELPDSQLLIVLIQRDSHPILYDPGAGAVVRKLNLAERGGNPRFKLRASAAEFWASDYDTILKLDAETLDVVTSQRLQGSAQSTRHFIGDFSLCRRESLCLVPRPFSGDAIGIDCDTMRQTHRANLGKQPLRAGLLGEDRVVALDWKTGEFLAGTLEQI